MHLETDVAKLLIKHNRTIAVAESCTGGLISHLLTNISGSSKYFKLGIVAYSTQAKISQLNISKKIIARYSSVSSKTALSMAKSIRKIARADIGLSVTGIAGPCRKLKFKRKPKQDKKKIIYAKPVGLIYIGLAHRKGAFFKEFQFEGARRTIKLKASLAALRIVKEWLRQSERLSL